MRKSKNYGVGASIAFLVIWAFFIIGWILNIIDLIKMDIELTGVVILKIIGIFILPLGSIMGWFF